MYKFNKKNVKRTFIKDEKKHLFLMNEYLDKLKVDIFCLEVCDGHDGVDGNLGHLVVALVDDFGAKGSFGGPKILLYSKFLFLEIFN